MLARIKVASALTFCILSVTSVTSFAQSDYVVVKVRLDQVMQPKNAIDVVQDCANNAACRTLVDAAATYLGAPPGKVSAALAGFPRATRKGEEGLFTFSLPSGYQYCRSRIETISVTPASGDRASALSASSEPRGVGVYTWTPRQGVGRGRSWVEADFTIYGVRDDIADSSRSESHCRVPGKRLIDCRGAKGVNKGKPSCGVSAD